MTKTEVKNLIITLLAAKLITIIINGMMMYIEWNNTERCLSRLALQYRQKLMCWISSVKTSSWAGTANKT